MSRSYHATLSQLRGQSKKEIDKMALDPDSILKELATKSSVKKKVKKERKESKIKKGLSGQ